MTEATSRPVRFHTVVPQFTVPDFVKTAEYYRDVLGFHIADYWQTPPVFAIVWRDTVEVFFNQGEGGNVRTGRARSAYDAYFRIAEVEVFAAELRQRGAEIVDGPAVRVYDQREVVVKDCNGLVLAFGEPVNGEASQEPEPSPGRLRGAPAATRLAMRMSGLPRPLASGITPTMAKPIRW
jgi:catechol 2,3-dioxygenase-like lactoylglutathione lyase family enzyme